MSTVKETRRRRRRTRTRTKREEGQGWMRTRSGRGVTPLHKMTTGWESIDASTKRAASWLQYRHHCERGQSQQSFSSQSSPYFFSSVLLLSVLLLSVLLLSVLLSGLLLSVLLLSVLRLLLLLSDHGLERIEMMLRCSCDDAEQRRGGDGDGRKYEGAQGASHRAGERVVLEPVV
jgi:hypothetical protein